ncbi:MAG: hypothetical protein UX17_C0058G0001, partial [Parcubacteria group bacterium GW2011_GWC2_45_7]
MLISKQYIQDNKIILCLIIAVIVNMSLFIIPLNKRKTVQKNNA